MEKDLIVSEWLEGLLRTYPEEYARRLRLETDPFRSPVGHVLKEGLSVLVNEILGSMDRDTVKRALDGIIRVRAVQDFPAGQAVSFVFLLRDILRKHLGEHEEILAMAERRTDELAVLACDLFMNCREQMYEIKANEFRRSTAVFRAVTMRERAR